MDSGKQLDDLSNKGQSLADKAADKLQGGIRDAKQSFNSAASTASAKVESARQETGPALDKVSSAAQGKLREGISAMGAAASKARDFTVDTQDSILSYTRENPVKALLIAAAAGAAILTLLRALSPSTRD